MFPRLDVEIRDTPFDPSDARRLVLSRDQDGRTLYKVWIYLAGRDVPFVKQMTYYLHETVTDPVRTVVRTPENPDCRLEAWLWGKFEVQAVVEDIKSGQHRLVHELSYDRFFEQETFDKEGLKLRKA